MIEFAPLRREDMPMLLKWRNASPGAWRDSVATTITKQYAWYDETVSYHQWFRGVYDQGWLIAQAQLYPVDWENKSAEIGLIVDPDLRGHGFGKRIITATLEAGFRNLGLNMIWGEVYMCTDAYKFWEKIAPKNTILRERKFWGGKYWDSLYFSWVASEWGVG